MIESIRMSVCAGDHMLHCFVDIVADSQHPLNSKPHIPPFLFLLDGC